MSQLSLFDRDRVLREEIRHALTVLDFPQAERKTRSYDSIPGAAPLAWERKVLRFGQRIQKRRLDLDAGFELWERFESSSFFPSVPAAYANAIRISFFSRLLAFNRGLFEDTRTGQGRSLGDFCLRAEQPRNARRLYERELREYGDSWRLRLQLGNCNLLTGDGQAARANYRQAFLLGLPAEHNPQIADAPLRRGLAGADDPDWAFPQAFVEGRFPSPRFTAREEFEAFLRVFLDPRAGKPDPAVGEPRLFSVHWVISENRHFCDETTLLTSRRAMKALHPRLHAVYMRNLEARRG